MPIYIFECSTCKKRVEDLSRFSEKNPPCPTCGTDTLVRQIGTGIHVKFNGVGWNDPLARVIGE